MQMEMKRRNREEQLERGPCSAKCPWPLQLLPCRVCGGGGRGRAASACAWSDVRRNAIPCRCRCDSGEGIEGMEQEARRRRKRSGDRPAGARQGPPGGFRAGGPPCTDTRRSAASDAPPPVVLTCVGWVVPRGRPSSSRRCNTRHSQRPGRRRRPSTRLPAHWGPTRAKKVRAVASSESRVALAPVRVQVVPSVDGRRGTCGIWDL